MGLGKESLAHAKVARMREGEAVELMDGNGNWWRGVLEKNGVRVSEVGRGERKKPEIVLAVGLTQGGTMEDIVRQATELGVVGIQPLCCDQGAPILEEKRMKAKRERWERIGEEACKQSGLYWQPRIYQILKPAEVIKENAEALHLVAALMGEVTPWEQVVTMIKEKNVQKIFVWVGPEGDFSKGEYAALKTAGAQGVTLGATVLRVETASVAALALTSQAVRA